MRGVETYERERLADLDIRFLDVRIALFGGQQLVDRMLRNGLITMPAEAGLLLCGELDRAGVAPPWRQYVHAWNDSQDVGSRQDDDEVDAAVLRGRLRLLMIEGAGEQSDLERLLALARAWCDEDPSLGRSRVVVETVGDVLGIETAAVMVDGAQAKGALLLALAEQVKAVGEDAYVAPHGSAAGWANQALEQGLPPGWLYRARELGAETDPAVSGVLSGAEAGTTSAAANADTDQQAVLAAAAVALQQHSPRSCGVFLDALERCRAQPVVLDAVIAVLDGEGWYRCWLRFCVDLVRAEACAPNEASSRAMAALARLAEEKDPFAGKPRAVDLYQEMGVIWSTVARAVRLLDTDDWTSGITLLLDVGRSVTAGIDGAMGVPLPPDRALSLALDTAPYEHLSFLSKQIRAEIELSEGRFYSDIAEFHLLDTQVQLRRADAAAERSDARERDPEAEQARHEAIRAWRSACSALLGYGWHKDITVFEVLDPLETLIALDPVRGLERMVNAYQLAYRAWRHSDGRETRHAPLRWWAMLATADPVAHAENSLQHGLASRGERTRWEEMRQDLWTEHALSADPVLAVLVSATLPDAPRTNIYEAVLQRFAADQSEPDNRALRNAILQRALTRGDEAADSSRDSESTAYEAIVASLNAMASELGFRRLGEPVDALTQNSTSDTTSDPALSPNQGSGTTDQERKDEAGAAALEEINRLAENAPGGAPGVAVLTRTWQRTGANAGRGTTHRSVVDAYADAIGVRLKDMLDEGRSAEVAAALEALSDVTSLYDAHLLLARIGDGFNDVPDVSGEAPDAEGPVQEGPPMSYLMREMTARALALSWTQARGDGGWLAFGGSEHMELLSRATALAPQVASEAVGIAVERRLNGQQTMGVTKALIEAVSVGALEVPEVPAHPNRPEPPSEHDRSCDETTAGRTAIDAALAVWDEASSVISGRLPPTSGEEPGAHYDGVRHESPIAEPAISAQDYALVLATFAGLSHPGREHLRRTMIALEDLATLRPTQFALGLAKALASMTGAAIPVLLLTMVERVATQDQSLLKHSTDELRRLLSSDYLAVRALARRLLRLLTDAELPEPISDPNGFPDVGKGPGQPNARWLKALEVYDRAPFRPEIVNEQVDGFRLAVVELIAHEMDDEQFTSESQKAAREMGNREWPDAVLLDQHAAEEALQRAAGAIRAHLAPHGTVVTNAVEWEDDLGDLLKLTPVPGMFERGRIPRPALPPPPVGIEPTPQPEASEETRSADGGRQPSPWLAPKSEAGEPYAGWFVLAYCELRRVSTRQGPVKQDQRSYIEAGAEVDLAALDESDWGQPLGDVTLGQWLYPKRQAEAVGGRTRLAATAHAVGPFVDDRARLGLPQMLAPTAELVHVLDLSGVSLNGTEMVMRDPIGPALAHVVWRASYRHSDYHMSYPRLDGAALLLRPDLVRRLKDRWGDKLTWRSWSETADDEAGDPDN
jgi:hypothetical protein